MPIPPISFAALGLLRPVVNSVAEGVGEAASSFIEFLVPGGADDGTMSLDIEANAGRETKQGVTLDELRADAEEALLRFSDLLLHRIKQQGIDVRAPIELTTGADGSIVVSGSPARRQEIEAVLAQNEDLADLYHFLESTFSSLHEMEQVVEARDRFGPELIASADRFSRGLNAQRHQRFHIDVRSGEPSVRFE